MYINRVKNLYIKLGRSFRSEQKKKKKKKKEHVGSIEIPKDSNRQPSLANRSRDFNIRRYHLSNHLSLSLFLSKLPPSSSLSRVHHEWLYRWSAKRTREKEGREKNKRRSGRKRIRREDFALTRIKRRRFRNVTIFCIDRGDLSESMRKAYLTTFQRLLDSCRSPANLKYEPAEYEISSIEEENQLVPRFRETVMTNSDGIKFWHSFDKCLDE